MRSASTPSSGSQSSRWYFAFAIPQRSGHTIAAWSPAATPSFVWPSTIRALRRRDRDVGEQPDREPRADRRPGHRRDDRLRAADHVVDEVARLLEDARARLGVVRDLETRSRSPPALNAPSAPRTSTARVSSSAPIVFQIAASSPCIAPLTAFSRPAARSVIRSTCGAGTIELEARVGGVAVHAEDYG